jgi:hypothetical protein
MGAALSMVSLRNVRSMKKLLLILMAVVSLTITNGAQAGNDAHVMKIYQKAMQDAAILEANATRNHWTLDINAAGVFLENPTMQALLRRDYPNPEDRQLYYQGFLGWIQHEIDKTD